MSEKFQILSDTEHVLARPSMYLGSVSPEPISAIINFKYQTKTVVPGLIKAISEICDNAIDEAIRTQFKYATKISVSIKDTLEGWVVTVSDDGRGIPVVKHDGLYQAELCWTEAKAGSNFSDDNRITTGMNGVGSYLTAVYSTKFTGKSSDGKQEVSVLCLDNLSSVKTTVKKASHHGTTVEFYPDLKRFGITDITPDHLDLIRDRLMNLSIGYPELTFWFNGDVIKCPSRLQLAKRFHEDAISVEGKNYVFVIAPSGDDQDFRHLSYVNGLTIKNGGQQVDYIMDSIVSELQPAIKKKWKIDVLPANIKQHLMLGSWIRNFPNPKFDSQTKERLTNTRGEVKAVLDFDAVKLAKEILNRPAIIDPMIQAILYKKELADRLAAARAMKKTAKKKIANHLQAQDKDWRKRRLFITEGLSAVGSLISVRNSDRDGAYALRGKVMNTNGMKPVDFMKNKELSELVAVIGLDIDSPDYVELNYGDIMIMSDQDVDGLNIACLLIQFFAKWPQLFKEGRVKRVDTPLYIAKKGKSSLYFYSKAEYEDAVTKKLVTSSHEVSYIKGLGSLESEDYKAVLDNTRTTTIDWVGYDKLDMAFGDNADARKVWMIK